VKTGTEHYRRQWPHCGGNLVWQLHDVWPSTSWALVDVAGLRKPAYWAVQRDFAPTLLSFSPDGTLWVSTDVHVDGPVVVRERTFDGEIRWQATVHVTAAAGTSRAVETFPVGDRRSAYLSVEGLGVRNRQLLADPVELSRPRADVTVAGGVLTANAYAFQVQTSAGDCFDLEAGESREVADPAGLFWL
jgi:beta-mannosidase